MKKLSVCFILLCLLIILTGCENNSGLMNTDTKNDPTNKNNSVNNFIFTSSEITELESGFSAVRYDGDYAFDLFLEQGVGTQQSHTRFDILAQTLEENSTMTAIQVRDALDSVSKDNFGEFESTEWSIVFDQSALTATYYHRENYKSSYSFQLLNSR